VQKWTLESVISHCPDVLHAAATCLRVAKFERTRLPQKQSLLFSCLYDFLGFAKERATQTGCYLLHKRRSDDQIKLFPFALDDPRLAKSFTNRIGLLEAVTGFRQTLSMAAPVVANGRSLLRHAATLLDATDAILCLERVADSHILPILLTDRTAVLICADPETVAKVPLPELEEAIALYTAAIARLTPDSPALLTESLHQKLATSLFAKAVFLEDTELASTLSNRPFMTPAFKRGVLCYRIELGLKKRDESAYFLSHSLLRMSATDSERVEAMRLLGQATTMEAQRNLDGHRYTRASERYHAAMQTLRRLPTTSSLRRRRRTWHLSSGTLPTSLLPAGSLVSRRNAGFRVLPSIT
jgi:hypothetical protein